MAASAPAAYAAPEALAGAPVSQAADVYAFGLTLLQLLAASEAGGLAAHAAAVLRAGGGGAERLADPCAGAWPAAQAADLARLALRCALHASARGGGGCVMCLGACYRAARLYADVQPGSARGCMLHLGRTMEWPVGTPALAPTVLGQVTSCRACKLQDVQVSVPGCPHGVTTCLLLYAAALLLKFVLP